MQDTKTARATLKSINRHFAGWRHTIGGRWDGPTFAAAYPRIAAEYKRAAMVLAGREVSWPAPPTRRERQEDAGMFAGDRPQSFPTFRLL